VSELAEVPELMEASSRRWDSLRIAGHEWRHLETFDRAWQRHVSELRRSRTVSVMTTLFQKAGDSTPPQETREEWRLWLAKPDRIRTHFQVGDAMVTAVFIGDHWWSWSPYGFKANDGAPNSRHGLGPGEALIYPESHLPFLQMRMDGRADFLSRPAHLVTALPRADEAHDFDLAFHKLGLGADGYKLVVDAQTGILLRSEAQLEGDAFRVVEVDELTVNEHLDESLFDPNLLGGSGRGE
jgi:outer membrane lipoprotein-sorting protein